MRSGPGAQSEGKTGALGLLGRLLGLLMDFYRPLPRLVLGRRRRKGYLLGWLLPLGATLVGRFHPIKHYRPMKKAILLALLASPIGFVACDTPDDSTPPVEVPKAKGVSFKISGMT